MEFRVLGPLQVLSEDGRMLPLGGAKQRATLAMLLLRRNEVVSSDHLIDGLWGDSPPPAGSTLKTYVSRLRRVLTEDGRGARLVTRPLGYRLRVEPGELDLEQFETLLLRGRSARASGDVHTARECLVEALSTFTGTPLQDLTHAPFAPAEIRRLEELRLSALELRLGADLATGLHTEVIGELEELVALFPFREGLWGDLMLALYRGGRQGDALMAFDRARRTLADELGVNLGPSLQGLHRRILQQDPSLELARASAAGAPTGGFASTSAPQPERGASSITLAPPVVLPPSTRAASGEGRRRRRPRADGRRPSRARRSRSSSCSSPSSFRPSGEGGGRLLPSSVRELCCST